MASIWSPANAKSATLSTGHTYGWVSIPGSEASKPTILFLHGFPSTSYDWRHQIDHFSALGYRIIAPDLLGYGDTDKPAEIEPYAFKSMATDIVALLDREGVKDRVHVVGHDFGSLLLSQVINYYPGRLRTASFLAVNYFPPGEPLDIEMAKEFSEGALGFERFGYIRFFNEADCWKLMDSHLDSFFTLFYGSEADTAMDFYPAGKLQAWLEADRKAPFPRHMTEAEKEMRDRIFDPSAGRGYQGPTNWYKGRFGQKIGVEQEQKDGLDPYIYCPTLYVEQASTSKVHIPYLTEQTAKFTKAENVTKSVPTESHWIILDAVKEVNQILEDFLESH
ncbi:MAG: hypothetical protein M1820_001878 [Bogoriella megaspora]|nr:MAG: hypothetical protein M1820_001878 [Bogoriella megaspora]